MKRGSGVVCCKLQGFTVAIGGDNDGPVWTDDLAVREGVVGGFGGSRSNR